VPQVRAVFGANLGDTLPRFEHGVSSSHAAFRLEISRPHLDETEWQAGELARECLSPILFDPLSFVLLE
jgi:hypothetical protein